MDNSETIPKSKVSRIPVALFRPLCTSTPVNTIEKEEADTSETIPKSKVSRIPVALFRPLRTSAPVNTIEKEEADNSESDLQGGETKSDQKEPWALSDFEVGHLLDSGRYSKVYIAREKESRYVVALKMLRKSQISHFEIDYQVRREAEIHYKLCHPNVLRMFGYFHDKETIYFILEYAENGSLHKILKERGRFDEKTAAINIRDLTKALIYCHAKNVIHRDVKPENLLIGSSGQVKLCDFGWSVYSPFSTQTLLCGTLDYLPPEMIMGIPYDYAVDVWSLGVMCYELLVGSPPFKTQKFNQTIAKIVVPRFEYPEFISEKAKDFMGKLMVLNAKERLSLTSILQHPWVIDNAPEEGVLS